MQLTAFDITIFVAFVVFVIGFAVFMSRKEKDSTDYFLAGRGAPWPLIGFSLIAANISTEQFVGMSGAGAGNAGLAIASYEWVAAVTLVFVAMFFLPRFLRAGIFTIPEYLEYRYSPAARIIMSLFLLLMFVFVTTVAVVYSGGVTLHTFFEDRLSLQQGIWLIGLTAVIYTAFGGLKAVLWADLVQGSALIVGGGVVLAFALRAIGGWDAAMQMPEISSKMHMKLPLTHPELPWTILILGIWIPNFYYWGLNQYITQRTLAAKTLREGQLGVLFAASLKLIIPFLIVVPGIIAPQLFRDKLDLTLGTAADKAYPMLIRELIGEGWRGFVLAALAGAVISSLASMLNSASTIFTMDLYKRLIKPDAEQKSLVAIGRVTTVLFMIIACLLGPFIGDPRFGGVFKFIQEFQGMFSPGILAAFLFGFVVPRAPAAAGIAGMVACPVVYGGMLLFLREWAFLNRMAVTFVMVLILMAVVTAAAPLRQPVVMPVNKDFDMKPSRSVTSLGMLVILVTVGLYAYFW